MFGSFLLIILLLLAVIVGWHIIFPILGGVIAISAIVWFLIVGSILAFCFAIMLLFVLTGTGVFVLAFLALVWTVLAIVLFPILFPILLPLFVLILIISYFRRKQNEKSNRS